MIPHPDLPDTYEEWRYLKRKQIADLEARGHAAEKVEVIPAEFAGYCDRISPNPASASLLRPARTTSSSFAAASAAAR